MNKKILHLNFSDNGGAAIAVKRINECLLKNNIDSKILVAEKSTQNPKIICEQSRINSFFWEQKKKISRNLKFFFKTQNKNTHTISFLKSNILSQIDKYNPDYLNIHWIGNELISIEQIKKIKIPILWTLHDMWLYCGAEHYTYENNRFINGYLTNNRPQSESGFDLNKWVWKRKKKNLPGQIRIIATSNWQYNNAKKSDLLKDKKIYKLPLPIDTNFWKPIKKKEAKQKLGWDINKIHFLFGFSDYGKKYIKGLDTAIEIFNNYKNKNNKNVVLNIFGEPEKKKFNDQNINILGPINNAEKLRLIYSASDLLLNPSRLESFGQIALESLSCGLPVMCRDGTGTTDLISSSNMGYIIKEPVVENFEDFNNWFNKILISHKQNDLYKSIKERFSYDLIADQYSKILNN